MREIFAEIVSAAQAALANYNQTAELLEYPEVQADKGYYLSVLSQHNKQNAVKQKLDGLLATLNDADAAQSLLPEASSFAERENIFSEMAQLRSKATILAGQLATLLNCSTAACADVLCRVRCSSAACSKVAQSFVLLIRQNIERCGGKVGNLLQQTSKDGIVCELSFVAQGADVLPRLLMFSGAHKVVCGGRTDEFTFCVTPQSAPVDIDEKDIKTDLFHSGGAGGQNINKVETAVRLTHIPTNTVVVCQDERSQLRNKNRALETLKKKLSERHAETEKRRIEADFARQCAQRGALTFDVNSSTFCDARLDVARKNNFPPTAAEFDLYLAALLAKGV